jgi:hypothetical protein
MRNKLIIVIFISLFSFAYKANGQKLINSPYSRFNIGTLQQVGSFRSLGMGGVGTAERDNSSIYFTNPASYSSLDTNSFVFDFGVDYGRNFLSSGATKYSSDDLNFHHLVMGFPVTRGWGVAVGIVPVSSGFYQISGNMTSTDPGYDANVGEYSLSHSGDGGITKFFLGSGVKINKNFSVGANIEVLSGQLTRSNQFVFSQTADFLTVFHNSSTEKLELRGINFDYGIQYSAKLKNNYFLNIGASLTTGKNFRSKFNQLALKYSSYTVTDTISYTADNNTKTFLPGTLSVGVSFGKKNKFTTGIDYVATKWSTSKIPGSSGYAADTRNLLLGAEFIPDKFSNYSFINRIEYRLGGHIGDNYLILNGEQIKEYGVSLGLGIPMRQASTGTQLKANLFLDFTRRTGSPANSLHSEDYLTLGISFNLYDFWFIKRKYD